MQIWSVGVSRYVDNKHHIEDIVAGWILGATFAAWGVWVTLAMDKRLRGCEAHQATIASVQFSPVDKDGIALSNSGPYDTAPNTQS